MKNKLTHLYHQAKEKTKSMLASLAFFLTSATYSLVYADDPFEKTQNLAQQGISKVQGIGIITLGLAVVVTGLVYGFGGRDVKAAIKKHWMAIAIAIVAVAAGPSIIEWAFNFVKS
ncbi:TPA: TrbC/VirB2 family protein [Streptococcus pyogenes]|nr:TrbC/VirB2 family protein [Streptococcus pyogenes]